jgi:ketosteroid isomerase-like protein
MTANSREETESVVRAYCEAWEAGDVSGIFGLYHDDFTLHYFGRSPMAGDHVGKAAAVAALVKVQTLTNRKLIEIHDVLSSADHGAVLARERFEQSGKTLEVNRILLYHVKDGKLAECWLFDDDQRAVDDFWSGE